MTAFVQAHAKALVAFATAEAASLVVAIQADHTTVKDIVLAVLLPIAVGGVTYRVPNKD